MWQIQDINLNARGEKDKGQNDVKDWNSPLGTHQYHIK